MIHPLYPLASQLTGEVVGAAIEVHRDKGPGLVETIYEWCLARELDLRNLSSVNQRLVRISYKGFVRDEPLRFDLLVSDRILVEVKSVEQTLGIHKAQLLSYMRLLDVPLGLLINFNVMRLTDGVSRLILPGCGDVAAGSLLFLLLL